MKTWEIFRKTWGDFRDFSRNFWLIWDKNNHFLGFQRKIARNFAIFGPSKNRKIPRERQHDGKESIFEVRIKSNFVQTLGNIQSPSDSVGYGYKKSPRGWAARPSRVGGVGNAGTRVAYPQWKNL
ncbi:MAG: hypothetical protein HUK09_00050 [Bacteroidaceae bacterium]|nr:hypothetical protein [Bacteroidaceae bacterium]